MVGLILAWWALTSAQGATFTVVNTNDEGPGSLRQAILDANATEEADSIAFNIPGSEDVFSIQPRTFLPVIFRPLTLDGYTQPGSSVNTKETGTDAVLKIELDGTLASGEGDGLTIATRDTVVRGLVINGFSRFGIRVGGANRDGSNTISGNYIGCDSRGARAKPNRINGIAVYVSDGNRIGGSAPADRNVLSGSGGGVEINDSRGGWLVGNYIGTDAAGTASLGNTAHGVSIWRSAGLVVGGTSVAEGNLVSGNGRNGVQIFGPESVGNQIAGNRIGTDVFGTSELGNGGFGILIDSAPGNRIGSLVVSGWNLVSGNRNGGVLLGGTGAERNEVAGNLVGTDITGRTAITNFGVGIYLVDAPRNQIGGVVPTALNLVSGNRSEGIALGGTNCVGNVIQGNRVGTDLSGTTRIANFYSGINLGGARSNLIGGNIPGARNVLSGNQGAGIHSFDPKTSGNIILGNLIGLDAAGVGPLGNGNGGILLEDASATQIGGTGPNEGNVIAHNSRAGVGILSRTNNVIRGNRIFNNGQVGIDLGYNGVTDNDAIDTDTGANLLQNFPILTNVVVRSGEVVVSGRLRSRPNGTYLVDFYTNPPWVLQGSGYDYLGTTTVTTDSGGRSEFAATFPSGVPAGYRISATATDAAGNTSEFCRAVPAGLSVDSALRFVTAPVSVDAVVGEPATFRALAEGQGPVSYQWLRDGREIAGATEPGLTVTAASVEESGQVSVRVSDSQGTLESVAVRLRIQPGWVRWTAAEGGNGRYYRLTQMAGEAPAAEAEAVAFGGHLASVESAAEQRFLERAFLKGGWELTPFWIGLSDSRVEGRWEWLGGATSTYRNWTPGQPQGGDAEDYVAMNWGVAIGWGEKGGWHDVAAAGTSLENDERIDGPYFGIIETTENPDLRPSIDTEPVGGNLVVGSDFTLSAAASGPGPFAYQWRRNGQVITSATRAELVLTNLALRDAGLYSVVVRNGSAATLSRLAEVLVWSRWETNGHSYALTAPRANWPRAEEFAVARGGHLVTVNSAEEQAWLVAQFVRTATAHRTFWLGFTDQREEGQWNWISGEPVTYTGWDSGEPNNFGGNEDYALLNFIRARDGGFREGGWADEKLVGDTGTSNARARGPYHGIMETTARPALLVEITRPPASREAMEWESVVLSVEAVGAGALTYQWQRDGTNLVGEVGPTLNLTEVRVRDAGSYRVVVSSGAARVASAPALLSVLEAAPVVIVSGPRSVRVALGGRAELSVVARGVSALSYQWRLNGQDVDGATNAVWVIPEAGRADAGRYTVWVSDGENSMESPAAEVEVELPELALVDAFGDRVVFVSASGMGRTNNVSATGEAGAGEPKHAGKRGGKSLWMTWRPEQSGVATFRTAGSNFDTLLAVYTGSALGSLVEVASDEDSGGFLTSVVRFNAEAGREYQVVVDGFAGATGAVVLSWDLEVALPLLPQITQQPGDRVGILGEALVLKVEAGPPGVTFQWFRNGVGLAGRTAAELTFDAVQPVDAGAYRVRVQTPGGAVLDSDEAVVDVVDRRLGGGGLSADKVDDLFTDEELRGDGRAAGLHAAGGGGVATGLAGSQWTDTRRSTRSQGDPRVCDVATTATRWFRLRFEIPAGNTKMLELNSEGSEVPAMIAVYTNRAALTLVGCDAALPPGRMEARVSWVPQRGVDYLVLVDGVRGARGRIQLNRKAESEETPLRPTELRFNAGKMVIRMFPLPGLYDWRVGRGLEAMETLFRTNLAVGEFLYEDPEPAAAVAGSKFFHLKGVGDGVGAPP